MSGKRQRTEEEEWEAQYFAQQDGIECAFVPVEAADPRDADRLYSSRRTCCSVALNRLAACKDATWCAASFLHMCTLFTGSCTLPQPLPNLPFSATSAHCCIMGTVCREYVPVAQRRAAQQQKQRRGRPRLDSPGAAAADSTAMPPPPAKPAPAPEQFGLRKGTNADGHNGDTATGRPAESLLKATAEAHRGQPLKTAAEKAAEEEKEMMAAVLRKQALRSVQENAFDVKYDKPLPTGWLPPQWCALCAICYLCVIRSSLAGTRIAASVAAALGCWDARASLLDVAFEC